MAVYSLLSSVDTVQVLSPTLTNDVLYCTIRTNPSGVVASMPIPIIATDTFNGNPELTAFAQAIEQIMSDSRVIAAQGAQTIDPNGLIQDQVAFIVAYNPAGATPNAITGVANVPVASLNFTDGLIGATLLESVEQIIDNVYNSLGETATAQA